MPDAYIIGIGTALPGERYPQMELFEQKLKPLFGSPARAGMIFANVGIDYRHFAVYEDFYRQNPTTETRNNAYMQIAQECGQQAVMRCLEDAGCSPEDVDDFIVISCTGIDTPGLDLILAGKLGMRHTVRRSSILGMGCYAALPGLHRATQSIRSGMSRKTLVLAVEICSIHLQLDDDSLENAVSAALFGDGAAAVLISSETLPARRPQPRLVNFATYSDYNTLDQMAFHLSDHGFQMRLSAYVPKILSAKIEEYVDDLLAGQGLSRDDISVWGVHPGSAKILDYTRERLTLPENALDCSYGVLRDFGNMSSPTILFILKELQSSAVPQPGAYGVIMAFGPGLTIDGALLQW